MANLQHTIDSTYCGTGSFILSHYLGGIQTFILRSLLRSTWLPAVTSATASAQVTQPSKPASLVYKISSTPTTSASFHTTQTIEMDWTSPDAPPDEPFDGYLPGVFLSTSQPPPTSPLRDRLAYMQRLQAVRRSGLGVLAPTTTATSTMPQYRNADEFLASGISKVEDLTSTSTFSPAKSNINVLGETSSSTANKAPATKTDSSFGTSLAKTSKKRKSSTTESCECPICYNPIGGKATRKREEAVRIATCGHIFGRACLETHVKSGHPSSCLCPMCRAQLWRAPTPAYGARYRRLRLGDLDAAIDQGIAAMQGDLPSLQSQAERERFREDLNRLSLALGGRVDGGTDERTQTEHDAEQASFTGRIRRRMEAHQGRAGRVGSAATESAQTNQGGEQESLRDRIRRRLEEQRRRSERDVAEVMVERLSAGIDRGDVVTGVGDATHIPGHTDAAAVTGATNAAGTSAASGTTLRAPISLALAEIDTEIQDLRNRVDEMQRMQWENTPAAQSGGAAMEGLQEAQSGSDSAEEADLNGPNDVIFSDQPRIFRIEDLEYLTESDAP